MTRHEAIETERMLERLAALLCYHNVNCIGTQCHEDVAALRRISMTLHRWHEYECGVDGGGIERVDGRAWWYNSFLGKRTHIVPDREAGALKRLAAIMARYPSLSSYVQSDPRGCALYILKPGDVPADGSPDAYYSRGLAVHQ